MLTGIGEPSLAKRSQVQDPAYKATYRFIWLRSFDAPMIVRIEKSRIDTYRLTAIRLSGRGGYDKGEIAERVDRTLTKEEVDRLVPVLERAGNRPETHCRLGLDGAGWMFEEQVGSAYSFRRAWTPKDGPVREVGDAMLALLPWDTQPRY